MRPLTAQHMDPIYLLSLVKFGEVSGEFSENTNTAEKWGSLELWIGR